MLYIDCTEDLLGLKDAIITKVENIEGMLHISHCNSSFLEMISFLPKYQRMTTRMVAHILDEFRTVCSIKSVSNRYNISEPKAARLLDYISYSKPSSLPEVISIDEFKGNAGGHKF